jgi:uncharacterized repeat protein (TIGR03917 family)
VLTRSESAGLVEHQLSCMFGAPAEDVSAALVEIPAGAVITDGYGDVDLTLIFREVSARG